MDACHARWRGCGRAWRIATNDAARLSEALHLKHHREQAREIQLLGVTACPESSSPLLAASDDTKS